MESWTTFGLNFLAHLKRRAIAHNHQIAFLKTRQHFVFVRRLQAKRDRALFDFILAVDHQGRWYFAAAGTFDGNGQHAGMVFNLQHDGGVHARHQFQIGIGHFDLRGHLPRFVGHLLGEP